MSIDAQAANMAIAGFSAVASFVAAAVAYKVYRIAENFREVDWIRQQNDAWNHYNTLKFQNGKAFKDAEDAMFTRRYKSSFYRQSYETQAVIHLRLNLMEKDARALIAGSIAYGDRNYLVQQIRDMVPNLDKVVNFMEKERYDECFIMLVEKLGDLWSQDQPPTDRAINRIFAECKKAQRPSLSARVFRSHQRLQTVRSSDAAVVTDRAPCP